MPWLVMDEVLFIHVPRCGGTSITKHHRVGYKARQGKNPYYKFGLMYYYYRYKLLENANFPLFSYENLLAMIQIMTGIFIYFFAAEAIPAPYVMWTTASFTFLMSTVIWTAPVTMRNNTLRWLLMMLQSKVLCGLGGDNKYMVGTNEKAYLFHITTKRAIKFGYITKEQAQRCAFSIVRNPYSRMVSMYEYNKRPFESFEHFVRTFHREYLKTYVGLGSCECADIYCHILPMHEYTHIDGTQVVSCVIKQEHLKNLVATDWEGSNVPVTIQKAMTGIPHANKRSRSIAWQQYYTQETMNTVFSMYEKDFEIFGYDQSIPGRPDLVLVKSMVPASRARNDMDDVEIPIGPRAKKDTVRRGTYSKMKDEDEIASTGSGDQDAVPARFEDVELLQTPSPGQRPSLGGDALATSFMMSTDSASCESGQPTREEDASVRREASVFVLAQT